MASSLKIISAVMILTFVLAAGAGALMARALAPVAEKTAGARTISFEIEPGEPLRDVAHSLEAMDLIRSARMMGWLARATNLASSLKVGEYELSRTQSTREILEMLAKGRVRTHAVVIPEGKRASEIATLLAAADLVETDAFLAVVFDPQNPSRFGVEGPSLEGYLFPDTYRFSKNLPPERIARTMVREFLRVYNALPSGNNQRDLSMREQVTLASIVEKETGAAKERPLIAAVFLNRLKRGMRLETDPTVIYGIDGFNGNLRRRHLADKTNPYNTYWIQGLPPGPIASPGRESLRAVREPADTSFLYFVSRNDGTHRFSNTYREHERAVDRFQRRRQR